MGRDSGGEDAYSLISKLVSTAMPPSPLAWAPVRVCAVPEDSR